MDMEVALILLQAQLSTALHASTLHPTPPCSGMIHTDHKRSDFNFWEVAIFSPRFWGGGRGYNQGKFVYITTASNCTWRRLAQVFTFYLCPHREDQHHSDTPFYSLTLMFQAQYHFRHLKYIIWRLFKNLKMHLALVDSASRKKVHDHGTQTAFIPEWLWQHSTRTCSVLLIYYKSKAVNVAHY